VAQSKVPVIGWGTQRHIYHPIQWAFGINGNQNNSNVQGLGGATQILKATGNTKTPGKVKVAMIAENISPGITANNALAGAFKSTGMKIVYKEAPHCSPWHDQLRALRASHHRIGCESRIRDAGFR